MSTVLKILGALLSLVLLYASAHARADVVIAEPGSNVLFYVDGKQASALEAKHAAETSKSKIERCSPIKDAKTSDGKPAFRCKQVIESVNPKNGNTTWKNL